MKKREKQELKQDRIREYIRSGEYKDAGLMEIALESEFGHRLGRLSKFEKQEIDGLIGESSPPKT